MANPLPPRFDAMVAPARARPQLWRLIAALVLTGLIYAGFVVLIVAVGSLLGGGRGAAYLTEGFTGDGTVVQTLLLMLTFAGLALGVIVAARIFNARSPGSLFGTERRDMGRDFLRCFAIVFVLMEGSALVGMAGLRPVANLPVGVWATWLVPAAALLLVQITAEELLFRGYIQTQLAARFASPLIWLGLPAIAFGLAHYNPAEAGANAWVLVFTAALYGLIAADLTARTGNLGAVMGFHLANNVFAVLIVSVNGTITGLSLYRTPFSVDQFDIMRPLLIQDAAVMILAWVLCRLAVRR